MAKKKTMPKDEANEILMQRGVFSGLMKIFNEVEVSKEEGAKIKAGLFKFILKKVVEAKNEIAKLQASVMRLEAACRAGSVPQPAEGNQAFTPSVERLTTEMKTFDGWVISLLESDISLLATVFNPDTAGTRVKGLREAFAQLWTLRQPGHKLFDNHPDVFDMSVIDVISD